MTNRVTSQVTSQVTKKMQIWAPIGGKEEREGIPANLDKNVRCAKEMERMWK